MGTKKKQSKKKKGGGNKKKQTSVIDELAKEGNIIVDRARDGTTLSVTVGSYEQEIHRVVRHITTTQSNDPVIYSTWVDATLIAKNIPIIESSLALQQHIAKRKIVNQNNVPTVASLAGTFETQIAGPELGGSRVFEVPRLPMYRPLRSSRFVEALDLAGYVEQGSLAESIHRVRNQPIDYDAPPETIIGRDYRYNQIIKDVYVLREIQVPHLYSGNIREMTWKLSSLELSFWSYFQAKLFQFFNSIIMKRNRLFKQDVGFVNVITSDDMLMQVGKSLTPTGLAKMFQPEIEKLLRAIGLLFVDAMSLLPFINRPGIGAAVFYQNYLTLQSGLTKGKLDPV